MKTISFLLAVFVIPIIFVSCNKDELDYADESIIINSEPDISIYKTNGDYFQFVYIGIDSIENITMSPAYTAISPFINIDKNGNVIYTQRWKLKTGYIVCKEMRYKDMAFTNITFQELIEYTNNNGGDIPDNWFKTRIIDKNPFTEYYWFDGLNHQTQEFTLGQINKMIETGTIETVFKKIK